MTSWLFGIVALSSILGIESKKVLADPAEQTDPVVNFDQQDHFQVHEHARPIMIAAPSPSGAVRTADASRSRRSVTALRLPSPVHQQMITTAERRYRLPVRLLGAVAEVESDLCMDSVSSKGAIGIMQLMPATARMLGVVSPLEPWANIDGGARYLSMLLARFGSVTLALAAYNAGPTRVRRAGGLPRIRETQDYVEKVLRRWRGILRSDALLAAKSAARAG